MDERQKSLEFLNQRKSTRKFGRTNTPRTSSNLFTSSYRNDTVDTERSSTADLNSSRGMTSVKS